MGRRRNNSKRKQPGLAWHQERRLRRRLRRSSPSEPWVEAQIVVVNDLDPDGGAIHYVLHDPSLFPPGGSQTRMVRCRKCGIYNPPNAMEGGCCLDHAEPRGWGPSLSAQAIQAMERLKVGLHFCPLRREDVKSLRKEIKRFKRRQRKERNLDGSLVRPVASAL